MADFPAPTEGIVLTQFIVADDVARSRAFYTDVLGGEAIMDGEPSIVALANSWIIINTGGGPTDDKPSVVLQAPTDPDRVSAFLNIRVADIAAVYADWSAKGGQDEPIDFEKARQLRQRMLRGERLSEEERAFLERAKAAFQKKQAGAWKGSATGGNGPLAVALMKFGSSRT